MLRLGIIGTNTISDNLVNNAKTVDGVALQAVYSRRRETGDAFAAKHGIPKVYTDLDEFLQDGEIDAVYVASPNALHAEQTLACLRAGKHVLCEKPLASTLAEYREMKDTAIASELVFLDAMRPMHDPVLDYVLAELPKIGRICHARFEYCQYSSRYDDYKKGIVQNAFNPLLSNAALMDIGVYCIFWCVRLFGRPEKILSHSSFLPDGFECDGSMLLDYGDRFAEVLYSKVCDSVQPSIIVGEEGSITIGPRLNSPALVTTRLRSGETYERTADYSPYNLKYEVATFKRLVEENCVLHPYYAYSDLVMETLETVRRQNGIVFPADKH